MDIQWSLVVFSLMAGCGAAGFAFVGLSELLGICRNSRFVAALASLAFLAVGGIASVTHLASPNKVMYAIQHAGSFSGISVELMLLSLVGVLMIVYLILAKRENAAKAAKVVAVIGLVVGLVMCYALGNSYQLLSRPAWNTVLLPLSYFGTSLAAGGFLFLSVAAFKKEETDQVKKIGLWVLVAAVICAVALIGYAAFAGSASGANVLAFWGGMVACGIVLTLVLGCGAWGKIKMPSTTVGIAGLAATLLGGLGLRAFMWAAGAGFLSLFSTAAGVRVLFGL